MRSVLNEHPDEPRLVADHAPVTMPVCAQERKGLSCLPDTMSVARVERPHTGAGVRFAALDASARPDCTFCKRLFVSSGLVCACQSLGHMSGHLPLHPRMLQQNRVAPIKRLHACHAICRRTHDLLCVLVMLSACFAQLEPLAIIMEQAEELRTDCQKFTTKVR